MFTFLLDLFFPRVSLTGEDGALVTAAEEQMLRAKPMCVETAELRSIGIKHLDRLIAAGMYDDSPLLKTAIHRFKYTRMPAMKTALGKMLVRAFHLLEMHPDSVLCPVPLHWSRSFLRGFNQ